MAFDAIDQIRLLVYDTVSANQVFSDDDIRAFLALNGNNTLRAAAMALMTIATQQTLILKVIRNLDLQTDGAKLGAELRAQAADLRLQSRRDLVATPYAGGISQSDKDASVSDSDRVPPDFTRRTDDFPGIGIGGQPTTDPSTNWGW